MASTGAGGRVRRAGGRARLLGNRLRNPHRGRRELLPRDHFLFAVGRQRRPRRNGRPGGHRSVRHPRGGRNLLDALGGRPVGGPGARGRRWRSFAGEEVRRGRRGGPPAGPGRHTRQFFRQDGVTRRPPLPVILLEGLVDAYLGGRARDDLAAGDEKELVEDPQVGRISESDLDEPFAAIPGHRRMTDGKLRREHRDRRRRDVAQDVPGNVLARVLLAEDAAEIVLVHRAALEEQRADPSSGEVLDSERARQVVFGDQIRADEELSESRHDVAGPQISPSGGQSYPGLRALGERSGCYSDRMRTLRAAAVLLLIARGRNPPPTRATGAGRGAQTVSPRPRRRQRRTISGSPRPLPARHREASRRRHRPLRVRAAPARPERPGRGDPPGEGGGPPRSASCPRGTACSARSNSPRQSGSVAARAGDRRAEGADEIAPGDPSTAATLARALLAQGNPAQAAARPRRPCRNRGGSRR